ncbi:hypothetical protein BGW36DRAFT_397944 [Talaromyces proteolyticus]|uniref:Rhodopsin domain-containing protein n=1 Tax=Talaromyces proteolyticus TaxID=1131652 RepID=A0AAD4KR16_9EURO|nr:uncharacterized protein BGW36DRAFT_397944 [Talaromyces proteolyticus]KAH8696377.1 hypothetical protein BGW36DRAFT_397944 [Talaromyces proteolyticus]
MRTPSSEVIVSWSKPNHTNPSYQGPQLLIIGVILIISSSAILSLRLWVRIRMKRCAGWDDWIMVAVIPFIICSTVTTNLGTKYGLGYHIWDNKPEWLKPSLMTSYFNQLLIVIIMTLVKVSLLISYLRFLTVSTFRHLSWAIIALILVWGLSFLITILVACRPLHAYWDTTLDSSAECSNEQARTLAFTITNLIFDIIVLILPVPTLWKLQLPIRERLVLIGLMSLGIVACAASAVRLYYANRIYNISFDVTWDGYQLWLWVLVEINLAVICASIPTIRPLVRRYLPQLGFKGSSYAQHFNMDDTK